jgi:tetratricopeptide (TPR) repeat protein
LAIREASLGPDHPATAANLNHLATVLHEEGDLAGARRLHERSLAIRETRLGPDHPYTGHSLTNLAFFLRDQGDLAGARSRFQRALAIYEASLGPDHPTTAENLNYLATVLHEEGDLAGARTLYERSLNRHELCAGFIRAAAPVGGQRWQCSGRLRARLGYPCRGWCAGAGGCTSRPRPWSRTPRPTGS